MTISLKNLKDVNYQLRLDIRHIRKKLKIIEEQLDDSIRPQKDSERLRKISEISFKLKRLNEYLEKYDYTKLLEDTITNRKDLKNIEEQNDKKE